MYPCPNCRAGLRFDIPKQLLVCDHCDSLFSPYDIGKEKDAVEHDTFEVTVYTCPQCGGELIADDDTAATFCSYCGGTTILDSRIKNEKRPSIIIPFKRTKENCEEAYTKLVKKAIYTPNAFKDPKQLEKFRAIYMPYWVYDFDTTVNNLNFDATKTYRKGDYVYTEHHLITGYGSGSAEGLTYDASSSFSDSLSEGISPFNVAECKEFTPSYFSGFYADTSDVDKAVYADDAAEMVERYNLAQTIERVSDYGLSTDSGAQKLIKNATKPALKDIKLAMLPVWFLSYKTHDKRMAYAVVNGQTGRVAADLPVDLTKFFGFSAITAVILFILLNGIFTITPSVLLIIVMILAGVMFFITMGQLSALARKEKMEDDQGAMFAQHMQAMQENFSEITEDQIQGATQKQIDEYIRSDHLALRCAAAVNANQPVPNKNKDKVKVNRAGVILPVLAFAAALLVTLAKPVQDMWYYGAAIGCIALVVMSQIQLINRHNKLTTRKPPQLGRRGGDENA